MEKKKDEVTRYMHILDNIGGFEKYNVRKFSDDEKMYDRIDELKKRMLSESTYAKCEQVFDRINDFVARRNEVVIDGLIWISYK